MVTHTSNIVESGWRKELPPEERRALVLKFYSGDNYAAYEALKEHAQTAQGLFNRNIASIDAEHFLRMYKKGKILIFYPIYKENL